MIGKNLLKYLITVFYFFSIVGFSEIEHVCYGEIHLVYINNIVDKCECQSETHYNFSTNNKTQHHNCCQNIVKYIKMSDSQIIKSNDFKPVFTYLFTIIELNTDNQIYFHKFSNNLQIFPKDKPLFIQDCSLLI